jgi:hypothetical protein
MFTLSKTLKAQDLLLSAALTLLAYIHRVVFLCSNIDRDWPFSIFYQGDSLTFFLHARALLEGVIYDSGIPFHPPGFPYFLALIHLLTGAGPDALQISHFKIKLLLALVGSLPVGLLYLMVLPYLGRPVALLSTFLCLYHFGLYVLSVAPVSEGLYLTILLLSVLLWSRCLVHPLSAPPAFGPHSKGHWSLALLLGMLSGFMALIRAEGALVALLFVGVGIAGWGSSMFRAWKKPLQPSKDALPSAGRRAFPSWRGLIPWILVVVGFGLPLIPWTIRNAVHLSAFNEGRPKHLEPLPTFVPLTLYGPLNLALANNAGADGTFSRELLQSRGGAAFLDLTVPQHLEYFLHGDQMAWRYIRQNPSAFAQLVLVKWGIFFEAFKLGWTQWDWPGGLAGIRRPVDAFVPYDNGSLWRLTPLCLIGLLCCLRAAGGPRRWAMFTLLLTACGLTVTAFFFGYVRQGLLFLPTWLTLSAAGIISIADWVSLRFAKHHADLSPRGSPSPFFHKPGKAFVLFVVLTALLLLALELRASFSPRNYRVGGLQLNGEAFPNPDALIHMGAFPDDRKGPAK